MTFYAPAGRTWRAWVAIAALAVAASACGGSPAAPTPSPTPTPTTEAPTLACQADVSLESPNGQAVVYIVNPPAFQNGSPPVSVTCDAPATFPVGSTTVSCTATDAIARQASCSFRVTVAAPPPPTLACPADVSLTSPDGLGVAYTVTPPIATNGVPPVTVSCDAPSSFPVGSTAVACTATDALARQASCSLRVTVSLAPRIRFTRFLAFGDSLTLSESDISESGFRYAFPIPATDTYPYRLQTLLGARYSLQSITVEVAGVSGESASDGLVRLRPALLARRPDVLLLMEGTNDLMDRTPDRVADTLDQMVRTAQDAGVFVFLATVPPVRPERNTRQSALVPELNRLLKDVATKKQVPVVDVYAPFAANMSLISADNLHPTREGYRVMAETWFAAIVATLETSDQSSVQPSPTFMHRPWPWR